MRKWLIRVLAVLTLLVGLGLPTSAPVVVAAGPQAATVKQDPQSITVYVTKTGKKYHRDGCRYLSKSKIPMSLKDAIAKGYTPCSVCKPPVTK